MNLWSELNIVIFEQDCQNWSIIPGNELIKLQQAQEIIQSARQRAAQFLLQARRQRLEHRQRFRRGLAQRRRRWQKQYRQRFAQAKEEGTQAALVWLVEQQSWERQVYQRLTQNIAGLLSQRLQEISQRLPWETLLFEHVSPLCNELKGQTSLTLKVAPTLYDNLPAEIASLPLLVEQDHALLPGDARLESPVVCVELKLPGQIAQLCEALETLRWEQLHESN